MKSWVPLSVTRPGWGLEVSTLNKHFNKWMEAGDVNRPRGAVSQDRGQRKSPRSAI